MRTIIIVVAIPTPDALDRNADDAAAAAAAAAGLVMTAAPTRALTGN